MPSSGMLRHVALVRTDVSEELSAFMALAGWALQRRRNVFPVRYELRFYISEDGILGM
jgi:hypothetical protein